MEETVPYIPDVERRVLDPHIKNLVEAIISLEGRGECEIEFEKTGGRLNYTITELMMTAFSMSTGPHYFILERIMGCLACISQEIYRRVGGQYEELAELKGGDISSFGLFRKWLSEKIKSIAS